MKMSRIFIILVVLLCAVAVPVFAQDAESKSSSGISPENESDMFYVNIPIEKIYPYQKGYVVVYRNNNQLSETYIPIEWFSGSDGKANLIRLGSGKRWPYLTVFYNQGEFSHLRLYVRQEASHETWGNIPVGVNLDDKFEGVETVILEF
ncbi:MAG: hypothetical protein LBV20_07405 [Treponema sp.]|jgi:hypothetical protein|nr:hypothetical protein [Treponema sp.]